MSQVAIDIFGRYPNAAQRWNQQQVRPIRWARNPKILVDIFYDKNSAPLDVDLSTRLGNTNFVVSVTNAPRAIAAPPSNAEPGEPSTSSAQSNPQPPPAPSQNQITIDTNGNYINANIIVPLRNHCYKPHNRFSKRYSNLIVDQFLKQAN